MGRMQLLAALSMVATMVFAAGPALAQIADSASPSPTADAIAVTTSPTADATPVATTAAAAQYQYKKTVTALPSTGGPEPYSGALALGAGALLVGGGLVARRIIR